MSACDLCGATDAPSAGRCALRNREACLAKACNRLSREAHAARAAGAAEERARIVAMVRQWAADVSDDATNGTLLIVAHGIERGET